RLGPVDTNSALATFPAASVRTRTVTRTFPWIVLSARAVTFGKTWRTICPAEANECVCLEARSPEPRVGFGEGFCCTPDSAGSFLEEILVAAGWRSVLAAMRAIA